MAGTGKAHLRSAGDVILRVGGVRGPPELAGGDPGGEVTGTVPEGPQYARSGPARHLRRGG